MGKSGGGNSGAVSYPASMQAKHDEWMIDIDALIQTYIDPVANSPYDGEAAYDPATPLASNQTRYNTFDAIVQALNYSTDWTAMVAAADAERGSKHPSPNADITTIEALAGSKAEGLVDDAAVNAVVNVATLHTAADAAVLADVDANIEAAITKAVSDNVDSLIEDMADSYEDINKPAFLRSINRFAGAMVDVNAVQTSTFIMGMAILEDGFQRDIRAYTKEEKFRLTAQIVSEYMDAYKSMMSLYVSSGIALSAQQIQGFSENLRAYLEAYIQNEKSKDAFLLYSVSEMSGLLRASVSFEHTATAALADINRLKILAEKEQVDKDIDLDVKDALWPFDVLLLGGNMLASISGAAHTVNYPMSTTQSAVSGAFSYGAAGAMVGSAIPGIGTAVGFGIGAAIGIGQAFL